MNYCKKILLISVLFVSPCLCGGSLLRKILPLAPRAFAVRSMSSVDWEALGRLVDKEYSGELAGPVYQKWAQKFYGVVGLPEEYRFDVKKIRKGSPIDGGVVYSQGGFVLINEDRDCELPYGTRRTSMAHEVIHAEQLDRESGMFGNVLDHERFGHVEQEATLRSAEICDCLWCSMNASSFMPYSHEDSRPDYEVAGYPAREEFDVIIKDQKERGALCGVHSVLVASGIETDEDAAKFEEKLVDLVVAGRIEP
ncbi:hypothetical protein HN446_01780 [bacterium]|jgi:hypothetical protein|nr:hypothetical protein [bacterium]